MTRSPSPGAALAHPVAVAALAVLVLNDHVLKRLFPSVLTGKLSDFAGVILLPLLLHALVELFCARVLKRPLAPTAGDRWLLGCLVLSLLAFGLPEICKPAESCYRYGLGAARWPFKAVFAWLVGAELPTLRPVCATADATDLLAMPIGLVAWAIAKRRPRCDRAAQPQAIAMLILLGGLTMTQVATAASRPATHDGFYLSFEAGPGLTRIDSSGSISNNLQQGIPSSATALIAPATSLSLGGTLARLGLVLGGRLAIARGVHPVIDTAGERFYIPGQYLILGELQAMALYYPDLQGGLHFGAAVGPAAVGVGDSRKGASLGYSGSLEAGYNIFIASEWSAGATLRLTAAHTRSQANVDATATALMPALLATITFH